MWRGNSFQTEITPVIAEYFQRKTLAELGYRFPPDLNCFKADCFGIIANQLGVLEKRDAENAAKKAKTKRR